MKKRHLSGVAYLLALVFCSVSCLFLSACTTNGTKSEQAIIDDIPLKYRTIVVGNEEIVLDVDKLTIDKRRLDEEKEKDLVYCTVHLTSSDYTMTVPLYLEYLFYDQGRWILEDASLSGEGEPEVIPVNGIPDRVAYSHMQHYASYLRGETKADNNTYYVTYDIEDEAAVGIQDIALKCEGSVVLCGKFIQQEWNEYYWDISVSQRQMQPTERIPAEVASEYAKQYYPSAKHESEEFDEVSGIHSHIFSVQEEHPYCTSNGTFTVQYSFHDYGDEKDVYTQPKWEITLNREAVKTDWQISGTWTGEFFNEGEHYDWLYPVSLTIESVNDEEVILSEGYYTIYKSGDRWGKNSLRDLSVPYEIADDGTLNFVLEFSGGYEHKVTVSPDGISAMFPWLNYDRIVLTRQS